MKKSATILSALAVAALPLSPCVGAIGDMWVDDLIAKRDISLLPTIYCDGGFQYGSWQEPLLYSDAKFNPLFNFPMLFHSIMCRLSDYCGENFNPANLYKEQTDFPGCATPAEREAAAKTPIPTLTNRNSAVSQLVPFFAAGGPTNVGIITIGPLMHAYGGSPLCVWPASNVVDVTLSVEMGVPVVDLDADQDANPLKSGVGRGGCFDVDGWLSCTNWSDCPHGFHTANHPLADLGAFFHDTLAPYFWIDWEAKGIPVPGMASYPESFFLTNSPNYLSAEPVPLAASNPALRIEPWRRSWEALGGLACVAWHTNTNAFRYEAVDVWSNGVLSVASSNAFVVGMTAYMNNGHPLISNSEYFPSDGLGSTKSQRCSPSGFDGNDVRPNDGYLNYQPSYILARGVFGHVTVPVPQDFSFEFTATNLNLRTLSAPVSNASENASVSMGASSVKKWKFRKVNEQGGERTTITNGTVVADFGYGEHKYAFEKYVIGPTSYSWEMVEEGEPVTHVELSAVSNFMQTAIHASLEAESAWGGLYSAWDEDAGPMRLSTVCTYDEALGTTYFVNEEGGKYGTGMDNFLYYLVYGYVEYADADELSSSAHPMPREPQLACVGYDPSYRYGVWTGDGHNYTIRTFGPPMPYSTPGGATNFFYSAQYSVTNSAGLVTEWRDEVDCEGDRVVYKSHRNMREGYWEDEVVDGKGFIPAEEAEAKSEISFTIDQRLDIGYKVEWTPVRAWGVLNNVTSTPDWPDENDLH